MILAVETFLVDNNDNITCFRNPRNSCEETQVPSSNIHCPGSTVAEVEPRKPNHPRMKDPKKAMRPRAA